MGASLLLKATYNYYTITLLDDLSLLMSCLLHWLHGHTSPSYSPQNSYSFSLFISSLLFLVLNFGLLFLCMFTVNTSSWGLFSWNTSEEKNSSEYSYCLLPNCHTFIQALSVILNVLWYINLKHNFYFLFGYNDCSEVLYSAQGQLDPDKSHRKSISMITKPHCIKP